MVRWLRHRRGDHRIYILAYHDVAGRDENESEGTLSGSRFQRHVAYVKQHYSVISLCGRYSSEHLPGAASER